jgi:hypothetical protein
MQPDTCSKPLADNRKWKTLRVSFFPQSANDDDFSMLSSSKMSVDFVLLLSYFLEVGYQILLSAISTIRGQKKPTFSKESFTFFFAVVQNQ